MNIRSKISCKVIENYLIFAHRSCWYLKKNKKKHCRGLNLVLTICKFISKNNKKNSDELEKLFFFVVKKFCAIFIKCRKLSWDPPSKPSQILVNLRGSNPCRRLCSDEKSAKKKYINHVIFNSAEFAGIIYGNLFQTSLKI